ncbi:hypothetical protein WJX77_009947 [Trebouxia sp. C0004]
MRNSLIIKEIERWGPNRFAAIDTDNAAHMVVAWRLVLEKSPKMVDVRCMMHAFSTCMGSLLGHQWAQRLIKRVQDIITVIRASTDQKFLEEIAKSMGIAHMLIISNKTRFTSVCASVESVLWLQLALQELAQQHPECLTDQLLDWFSNDMFFIMIKQLCKILEPFTLVIQAVQAACASLADVTRYWLYLAKMMSQLPFQSIDSALRKWCCIAFNMRQAEMLSPMCKLALFLHPRYRDALADSSSLWEEFCGGWYAVAASWQASRPG